MVAIGTRIWRASNFLRDGASTSRDGADARKVRVRFRCSLRSDTPQLPLLLDQRETSGSTRGNEEGFHGRVGSNTGSRGRFFRTSSGSATEPDAQRTGGGGGDDDSWGCGCKAGNGSESGVFDLTLNPAAKTMRQLKLPTT